ncbi:juvenile hormone acid O-methyltransferase-like [Chrysoperla carnea]|uniref:juvenile hormone acid O-methyltransferase-like n=1 Tax=Chrysoperla carnea TaxID=189513 RepID=UPI001D06FC47|nr:juvenile hormone acid O-methyltransferase-like [Chrysoperla carnea]
MNDPSLYASVNVVTRRDAKYLIDSYFDKIKWLPNGGDLVLDIGCGDGAVTYELLLEYVPKTVEMIVGTDVSLTMLKYANNSYQHPKLQFQHLDIATESLPKQYFGKFDHVFSNYCLHWVQDQRQAFQNIYDSLKPNGDVLVAYLAEYPLFSIYETISKLKKWEPYMIDYKKFVSPYHNNFDTENNHKDILKNIGYDYVECKCERRTFVYKDLISWRKIVQSVNPFVERIPESKRDEYIDELMLESKKRGLIRENTEGVTIPYELLIVYAQKRTKLELDTKRA